MSEPATPGEPTTDGVRHAGQDLLPLVYEDLRRLAAHRMNQLAPGQTLQATALVHEAWLRLSSSESRTWANRAHFFAAAAEAMRHVVLDNLRRKACLKRGGGQERSDIADLEVAHATADEKMLLISEALERLQSKDPGKARVVLLKFFGGLTDREVAMDLGVTERTIERHWAFAKAWLMEDIRKHF